MLLCPGSGQRLDPTETSALAKTQTLLAFTVGAPWELQKVLGPPTNRDCAAQDGALVLERAHHGLPAPHAFSPRNKATSSWGGGKPERLMLSSPSFLNSVWRRERLSQHISSVGLIQPLLKVQIGPACSSAPSHPAGMAADPTGRGILHSRNKTIPGLLPAGPSRTCAFPCKSGLSSGWGGQHHPAPEALRKLV